MPVIEELSAAELRILLFGSVIVELSIVCVFTLLPGRDWQYTSKKVLSYL